MSPSAQSSSGPSHGQKRRRNPDPYNDFGDGEYLGDETLEETDEVNESLEHLINHAPESTFKRSLRMSPSAFEKLLELIKEDHIFFGVPQPPLKYQLAVYLLRHGATGLEMRDDSSNEFRVAAFNGLTESTVARWCACVGYALMRLPEHFLDDLEPTEKRAIKKIVNGAKRPSAGTNPAKKARH